MLSNKTTATIDAMLTATHTFSFTDALAFAAAAQCRTAVEEMSVGTEWMPVCESELVIVSSNQGATVRAVALAA